MNKSTALLVVVGFIMVLGWAAHAAYSIPEDKVESQKIYFGSASDFKKAAEVSFDTVVRATPEYQEIRSHEIERGTGKYWVLMTRASERASARIRSKYRETDFDLLTERGYLETVDPEIPVEDITDQVVQTFEDN